MRKKKGFTIAELLIVVAIIAVLVAVAIPVFSTQLESSREGVDVSNLRNAYSAARMDYLTGSYKSTYSEYYASGSGLRMAVYDPETSSFKWGTSGGPPSIAPYHKAQADGLNINTDNLPDEIYYSGSKLTSSGYSSDADGAIWVWLNQKNGNMYLLFGGDDESGLNTWMRENGFSF